MEKSKEELDKIVEELRLKADELESVTGGTETNNTTQYCCNACTVISPCVVAPQGCSDACQMISPTI